MGHLVPQPKEQGKKPMSIEPDLPCERAAQLRAIRDDLITGKAVSEVGFGDDRVRYTRADMARLDQEIASADAACREQMGLSPAPRRRYAMGVRVRPY